MWFLNPYVVYNLERLCRSLYETVLFPFIFSKFISEHYLLEKFCSQCGLIQMTYIREKSKDQKGRQIV